MKAGLFNELNHHGEVTFTGGLLCVPEQVNVGPYKIYSSHFLHKFIL